MASAGPVWRAGDRELDCGERTLVMGVVNVTPDSFSDGGLHADARAAIDYGLRLVEEGADILDVGGESTRPGSDPLDIGEEVYRTLPVVERLAAEAGVPVSIDTRKAGVAAVALEAGATIVNDVSAGRDAAMFPLVAAERAGLVLMHMKGEPKTMQESPSYDDVVAEVGDFLRTRLEEAVSLGVERERIAVDPGLGFGKRLEDNYRLMRHVGTFADLGRPVVVGPSRKSFIGSVTGTEVDDRLEGTAGAVAYLAASGAHIVRVHDVRAMARVVKVVDAIRLA